MALTLVPYPVGLLARFQSREKEVLVTVIGIDLGTTNSLAYSEGQVRMTLTVLGASDPRVWFTATGRKSKSARLPEKLVTHPQDTAQLLHPYGGQQPNYPIQTSSSRRIVGLRPRCWRQTPRPFLARLRLSWSLVYRLTFNAEQRRHQEAAN